MVKKLDVIRALRGIGLPLARPKDDVAELKTALVDIARELGETRGLLEKLCTYSKLQMLGPERILEFQWEGQPIKLSVPKPYSDGIQYWIFTRETFYEQKELVAFRRGYVKDHMTFLDVGAHIGNHSVFFSRCCSAANVYAFEPNAASFELLKRNFSL